MTKYQPLSGLDLISLYRKIGGRDMPNILSYRELDNKKLAEILGPAKKCFILFLNAENYGHWCCLYQNSSGLCFFDSYGNIPDDQYDHMDTLKAQRFNGNIKELTKILYNQASNGVKIHYNQYSLQSTSDPNIATCGRWCIIRLLYPEISIKDFSTIFNRSSISPDDIISLLVN